MIPSKSVKLFSLGRGWVTSIAHPPQDNNRHNGACVSRRQPSTARVTTDASSEAESALSAPTELRSGLYVISTPLGNLGDVTLRALAVLKSVSCVYAEDTRHTIKLFNVFGVETPLISCHAHNEAQRSRQIVRRINLGEAIGIVSDAGTPMISDPGGKLISTVIREGLPVIPIPGPSAMLSAFVGSGFELAEFLFIGFLPSRPSDRRKKLEQFDDIPATLILYVAPSDVVPVLQACVDVYGAERHCCLAKELTKIHESFERGTLNESLRQYQSSEQEIKGEMTLLIQGAKVADVDISNDLILSSLQRRFEGEGLPLSEAVKQVCRELGVRKRRVYKLALFLKGSSVQE